MLDRDYGAQLPSGIVQGNLRVYSIYCERLIQPPVVHELIAAWRGFLPAGDAICERCGLRARRTLRRWNFLEVHRGHVAGLAVCILDSYGIAFTIVEHGDVFSALQSGYNLPRH